MPSGKSYTSDGSLTDLAAIASLAGDPTAYDVAGLVPAHVAVPASLDELGEVIALASSAGKSVAPRGGGTQTELGNRLECLDLVVDLSRLDEITHNPGDLTATAQAGVTIGALQAKLGERGQFLALDPPLPGRATVGGTLATGLSGPLKWQYGSLRDTVIGMAVAQPDGRVTRSGGNVVKNVSGYDMSRLHIGGLGTLGIIAEASFKLMPQPVAEATLLATFGSARSSLKAALGIFGSRVVPLAITAFDDDAGRRMALVVPTSGHHLAVRLGGRPLTLERLVRECLAECDRRSPEAVDVLDPVIAEGLWRGLADFGYDDETAPLAGARAFVQPSRVADLVEALTQLPDRQTAPPSVVSNPAHGTVLVRWYAADGQPSSDGLARVLQAARSVAHGVDGRLVIERCPAEVKAGFDVWDEVGDSITVMRRLKEQYDPSRTLNPGRFVGGI